MKAIRVHSTGGPEVLVWEEMVAPQPGQGEVLVRNVAVGVNFVDIYFRTGRYPAQTPFIPGNEGAGVIEALGQGVTGFSVGDRVAYIGSNGAYAELVTHRAGDLVRLPDDIGFTEAAAMMLKGITAELLVRRTYAVRRGDTILVHAAAGGVGQILCQWAAHLGATVIGTVGSAAKRRVAEAAGCAHVIVLSEEDFVARTRELTGGEGVAVAYDGVGADTFNGSLRCVRTRGLVAAFGASSGPIPLLDVQSLTSLGSIYVTRPGYHSYTRDPAELNMSAGALFDVIRSGGVRLPTPRTYRLCEAANAHADLDGRRTTGSSVLLVSPADRTPGND